MRLLLILTAFTQVVATINTAAVEQLPVEKPDSAAKELDASWQAALAVWLEFCEVYHTRALHAPVEKAEMFREMFRDSARNIGIRYREFQFSKPADGNYEDIGWLHAQLSRLSAVEEMQPLQTVESLIDGYCKSLDSYTRYTPAAELARLLSIASMGSGGIGMQLERASNGGLYCYPFPGGPAAQAGIKTGERLVSVNAHDMLQASLGLAALEIVGAPGTQLLIEVEDAAGRLKRLTIERKIFSVGSAMAVPTPVGREVKLRNFNTGAAQEMRQLLEAHNPLSSLVIDLRGNPGGFLDECVAAAGLFFAAGETLGSLQSRSGTETLLDSNPVLIEAERISLKVDARTASSAELFASILKSKLPDKVTIFGEKTYGKGVLQEQIYLTGAGRLTVTTARLFGPGGLTWNRQGILPD